MAVDLKDIDLKDIDLKDIDLKDIDLKDIDLKDIDLKDIDPKSQPARQNEVTFDLKSRPRSGITKSAPLSGRPKNRLRLISSEKNHFTEGYQP